MNWAKGAKPPAEIDRVVKAAINDRGWPLGVRQVLSEITFTWRARSRVDLAHTMWFQSERSLAVGPALSVRAVLKAKGDLATAHVQLLAFEFGKLIYYNANKRSDPLVRRFRKFSSRTPRVLPNLPEVREGADSHALFGYAYYYFVFEPAKLPKELVAEWRRNPPHKIVQAALGQQR